MRGVRADKRPHGPVYEKAVQARSLRYILGLLGAGDLMIATKRVFGTLDGMRGIAALAVVFCHAPQFVGPFTMPNGYLAVDLFFALSGCVLEAAYAERIVGGLSVSRFMLIRYTRLWPLYVAGIALGLVSAVAAIVVHSSKMSVLSVAVSAGTGAFLIPAPVRSPFGSVYPLNVPGWSLFFELFVNLVYIAAWKRLTTRLLVALVVMSGIALIMLSFLYDGIDMGSNWPTFWGGFARVGYSFFLGVLLHRSYGGRVRTSNLTMLLPLLLLPIFAWRIGSVIYDLLVAMLVLPALVAVGLRCETTGAVRWVFGFFGSASYAVYAIHYPLLELTRRGMRLIHMDVDHAGLLVGVPLFMMIFLVAVALDRWYDIPLRDRLNSLIRSIRLAPKPT
jgi:peptidoglycan/LPS O-acetylase OafA/YrhL